MESGSDTAMKSSSTSSKTVVEESMSSVSSSSKMIKQSSLSSEKQLSMAVSESGLARDAIESMAGIGASALANKMALMQLGGGDDGNLTVADRSIMGSSGGALSEIDVAAKQSSMSSATSSSSSLSTVSSVMKKSSATVVASSTSVAGGADSVPARKPSLTVAIPSKEEAPVPAPAPTPTLTAAPVPVVAPVAATATQPSQQKQEILSHTIKEIISDIDCNIKEEESIAQLKQQQQELLKKQQELAQQIRQQQLLAQQLTAENQLQQQQLQQQQLLQNQQQQQQQPKQQQPPQAQPQRQQPQQVPVTPPWKPTLPTQTTQSVYQAMPPQNVSKYSTYEETKDENGYTRKTETYQSEESSNVSKRIDLNKIFTPATDAEEILPKNRKLYASSAFYSPSLHPTVEDQVELARRISHSLSDISNQKSKGQSMYVNRKKRSVKWVHEGSGQDGSSTELDYEAECKENDESLTTRSPLDKVPLRLLMNPRGQMRDFNSLRESLNTETGLLSPDRCAELVSALQTQKGRGAELFAKRRRKSDKWVVDETNAGSQSPSGLPDFHQYQPKPPTSPSILPAYSDAGKHRVQLNMHQEQVLEKYAKPGLKVVKTPWEAALETGSASAAFVEEHKSSPHHTPVPTLSPAPAPQYHDTNRGPSPYGGLPASVSVTDSSVGYASSPYDYSPQHAQYLAPKQGPVNPQRELAYKPNLAQGWKAPSMALPKVYQQQQSMQQQSMQQQSIQQQSMQQQSMQQQSMQQQSMQQQQEQQQQWQLVKQQYGMYQQFQETTAQKREEHQVHQEYIDRAAQRCEAFTSKNDDEIIGFIRPEEVGRTQMQLQLQPQAPHEFINHLIRSPELRVSPMPPKNLMLYDSAMQEFQRGEVWEKQHQHQQQLQQQQQLHLKEVQQKQNDLDDCERATEKEGQNMDADAEEQQQRVNVRKQLQQFEEYQQQIAMQRRQEEILFKQREERLIRKQQQQVTKQMQQHQQQQHTEEQQCQQQEQQYHQQQQQQHRQLQQELQRSSEFGEANNHEQDDYVKVAVRDLISTFEQQTITEAEKLPKEPQSQRNQSHQEAQAQAQLQQQQQQQQQQEQQRDSDERIMREKMDRKMMMEFQEMQQQQQQQQYQRQQHQYKEQYLETQFQQQSREQHFQTSNATQVYQEYRAGVDEGRNKEELYVPKEIPLESYAPPPAVNMKSTAAPWRSAGDSGGNQYGSSYAVPAGKPAGSASFPLSQANSGGFSAGPNYDAPPSSVTASVPPKQQYWAPSSYQRVPQKTSQTAPPVNFNPSPLPYDKLAKFEGGADSAPSGNNYGYQPQRHLSVQQQGSKVRNASPTPFGRSGMGPLASPVPRFSPAYDNASNNYASSPMSPSPRPSSQQYSVYSNEGGYTNGSTPSSRISAADLLHGQNFNTSARGWRGGAPGGGIASYRQHPKQAPIATGNMPYTDF